MIKKPVISKKEILFFIIPFLLGVKNGHFLQVITKSFLFKEEIKRRSKRHVNNCNVHDDKTMNWEYLLHVAELTRGIPMDILLSQSLYKIYKMLRKISRSNYVKI